MAETATAEKKEGAESQRRAREIKSLEAAFSRAKEYRGQYDKDWERNMDYLAGKRQDELREQFPVSAKKIKAHSNRLFAEFMTQTPFLANREPILLTRRVWQPELQAWKETIDAIMSGILRHNLAVERTEEFVTHMAGYGRAYFETFYDPNDRSGQGDIVFQTIEPEFCYLEKGARSPGESMIFFVERPLGAFEIVRRYPDKAPLVAELLARKRRGRAGNYEPMIERAEGYARTGRVPTAAGEPPSTQMTDYFYTDQLLEDGTRGDELSIREYHIRDDSFVIEENEDTGEKRARKKYPNGRLVATVGSASEYGTILLEDRNLDIPISRFVSQTNYYIPRHPYSVGDLQMAVPNQKMLNSLRCAYLTAVWRAIGRRIYFDEYGDVRPEEIMGDIDEYVPLGSIQGILEGASLRPPRDLYLSMQNEGLEIQQIFGTGPELRGDYTGTQFRSGYAISEAKDTATNRMKLKTRAIESAYLGLGKVFLALAIRHYREGVHYAPPDGAEKKLKQLSHENFDFEVRAGVNITSSRASESEMYMRMKEDGQLDDKFLVDNIALPDKNQLEARRGEIWKTRSEIELLELQIARAKLEQDLANVNAGAA